MANINVAEVTTPTHRYIKAKARVEDHRLVVTDRRGGVVLDLDVQQERRDGGFAYGDVFVKAMSGCGCGGMRTETL